MKVLNVNMTIDPVFGGGTSERTFQISRHLAKSGVSCSILTTDLGLKKPNTNRLHGANVIALPCLFRRFYIPKCSFESLKKIIAVFDIIHLMNHWTVINALVYRTCRYLRKPYVVCPAGALPIYGRSRTIKQFYNWMIGKKIIQNADAHIAIATNEISQFEHYGIKSHKVSLIPNGINVEDFQEAGINDFRQKYGLNDQPFIMFMGRLNLIKGPDLLLRAFINVKDELQDFHLVFVGPDEGMLVELKQIANKMGVGDRVHFLGYIGGADKSRAYHAATLLVIPSRQEAMSIVVLEAGATGTPVLLTDQCGFHEIDLIGGGRIVPASVDGLQRGMIQILKNRNQLEIMGNKLKNYVRKHFSWEAAAHNYINLYDRIFKSRK